jgi:hypothetical protein
LKKQTAYAIFYEKKSEKAKRLSQKEGKEKNITNNRIISYLELTPYLGIIIQLFLFFNNYIGLSEKNFR